MVTLFGFLPVGNLEFQGLTAFGENVNQNPTNSHVFVTFYFYLDKDKINLKSNEQRNEKFSFIL